MSSSITAPGIMLAGGNSGNPAGLTNPGQLELTYQNLLSGAAGVLSDTGAKCLILTAGAIGTASSVQTGTTETAAEVANNLQVLAKIAAFCNANNIKVQVDANLTWAPTYGDGTNELVDQWAPVAASVGLPIAAVEDVQEVGISQSPSTLSTFAGIEANAVRTLIEDYKSSSYTMTSANLAVGDMEGGDPANMPMISQWWDAYDAAATADGVCTFSYTTADTGWFAPWIGPLAVPAWQAYLGALSTLAKAHNMALDIVVQGAETDASAGQYVQQAEQNAADLAMLQATGSVAVSNIMIQSWNALPVGVGMITSPTSSPNEAAEINAVYPLYALGSITAQGAVTLSAPGQIVQYTGTTQSIVSLTVGWDATDALAGDRLAVVVIDQTGSLNATRHGSGTVSSPASNILVLDGNSIDLAAELRSITLNEPDAGPDTIDVETYGASGRLSDNQISVLAAAPGQSVTAVNATSSQQGWVSSSTTLNNGTVITGGSVITSETFQWSTTGKLAGSILGSSQAGQTAFVNTVSIHEPLAEYGVESTATGGVLDVYDPKVDDGAFPANGYANNPGVNDVAFAPLPGWLLGSFDPAAQQTPLIVQSTTNTFDAVSGQLERSVDSLAPDPLTVVDATGTHADTFAAAFATRGTQVTEYNTANNTEWQAGWGNQFASATLTYDGAGQLVESFLQGGSNDPLFTIDDVFNPTTGQLWEQFQSTTPPSETPGTTTYATTSNPYQAGFDTGPKYVTEFNTGNNPNWDAVDWGTTIESDTEVWTDNFIMENFAGYVVNFPGQYAGALNAYPYQFVNGPILDLMYLPGTINVNLNALATVTIESQIMISGLRGINEIDAAGATGSVSITGLAGGGSTLVGGDATTTIIGSGHDTITAGAGVTTINTGSGGSTIMISNAAASVTVTGNNNRVTATTGSRLTLTGSGDILTCSGVTVGIATSKTNITVLGNKDVVDGDAGGSLNITGSGEVVNGSNMTIAVGGNTDITVNGSKNEISLVGPNITLSAMGNNAVSVTDTAADVASHISALQVWAANGELRTVVFTDSGTPTLFLSAAQVAADGGALARISSTYNVDAILVAAANATSEAALAHVAMVSVSDTASQVVANLGVLQTLASNGELGSITLTGSGTPTLVLSAAQIGVDAGALNQISTPYILDPTASEATIAAALAHVVKVSISDTAAQVAAHLDALQALAVRGKLGPINLTDSGTPALVLSAAQIAADADALTHISSPYTIDVTSVAAANATSVLALAHVAMVSVSDTTAHVAVNLAALQALALEEQLGSINFTGSGTPTLVLSAAQIAAGTAALTHISGPYIIDVTSVAAAKATSVIALAHVAMVSVSDTAAHVAANLAALQALAVKGQLGSINFTGSGTPTLVLSAAQIAAGTAALTHISGPYIIDVTSVDAAKATSLIALAHVAMVSVSDTAAHVAANLGALQALAVKGQLGSINFTGSGTPTLVLSAAQIAAGTAALTHISGPYIIDVTSVAAAKATSVIALAHVAMVSVSDTAAHVAANLAALQALAVKGQLGSINFTDSGTPTLVLSATQIAAGADALNHISSRYILDPTAAEATIAAAFPNVLAAAVADTAANVVEHLAALQALAAAGKLSSITLTDGGTPTLALSAAEIATDAGVLAHITSPYKLETTGDAAHKGSGETPSLSDKMGFIADPTARAAVPANNGPQTLSGFSFASGDRLDLSAVLTGASVHDLTLSDYLSSVTVGSNTTQALTGLIGSGSAAFDGLSASHLHSLINGKASFLPTEDYSLHEVGFVWNDSDSDKLEISRPTESPVDTQIRPDSPPKRCRPPVEKQKKPLKEKRQRRG